MLEPGQTNAEVRAEDLHVEWYSGSGAGGQHRNKHQNSARVTHVPTGIVKTAQTRSRESSLREATEAITQAVLMQTRSRVDAAQAAEVAGQIGSGMRGDKRRTYRERDDAVRDDRTGKSACYSDVMRGRFDLLWR